MPPTYYADDYEGITGHKPGEEPDSADVISTGSVEESKPGSSDGPKSDDGAKAGDNPKPTPDTKVVTPPAAPTPSTSTPGVQTA